MTVNSQRGTLEVQACDQSLRTHPRTDVVSAIPAFVSDWHIFGDDSDRQPYPSATPPTASPSSPKRTESHLWIG